jgi:surfeit locus 1 family protein
MPYKLLLIYYLGMFQKQQFIKIRNYKLELFPLAITIIGVTLLLALGIWQLYRLKEKTLFIASISHNLSSPAVSYDDLAQTQTNYGKIKLTGHFFNNKDIFLYGRKAMAPEKEGYYLLTPFQTTNGKIIMITRGWFAAKNKTKINITNTEFDKEITAIILPLERKKLFIPDNDLKNNTWFTLEHKQMMDSLGLNLENFYLVQIGPQDLPSQIIPINPDSLIMIKNDHLEYALTWFSLAICLIVIFIIYNKGKH